MRKNCAWPAMAALALVIAQAAALAQGVDKTAEPAPPAAESKSVPTGDQSLPGDSAFKQFKEDLFRPFENFKPRSALQPVLSMPYVPPAPVSKRDEELKERERNWMFWGMNELNRGSKPGDIGKMSDTAPANQGDKNKTSVEKYYEQSGRDHAGTNSLASWMRQWDGDDTNSMNPMNLILPGGDQLLRKMLLPGGEAVAGGKKAEGAAAGRQEVVDEDREKQRRYEEFKRFLDPSLPPLPAKGYDPRLDPLARIGDLMGPASSPGGASSRPATLPQAGALAPVLGVASPAGAFRPPTLGQPAMATPGVGAVPQRFTAEPPKPAMVKPMDPAANMPKRKF